MTGLSGAAALAEAEAAYVGAVARAGKLVTKGHRGVAEAGRRLSLMRRDADAAGAVAGPVNAAAPEPAEARGSFASVVKESTGATVTCDGAGMRALSAEEQFEQTAFEAALAGVEVEPVARRAARLAAEHVEREGLAAQVLKVVEQHGRVDSGRLASAIAGLMQQHRRGMVRLTPPSESVGRVR